MPALHLYDLHRCDAKFDIRDNIDSHIVLAWRKVNLIIPHTLEQPHISVSKRRGSMLSKSEAILSRASSLWRLNAPHTAQRLICAWRLHSTRT